MGVQGACPRMFEAFENIDPNRANLELSGPTYGGNFRPAPCKYILPCIQSTTQLVSTGFNGGSGWRLLQTKKNMQGQKYFSGLYVFF